MYALGLREAGIILHFVPHPSLVLGAALKCVRAGTRRSAQRNGFTAATTMPKRSESYQHRKRCRSTAGTTSNDPLVLELKPNS
jgi:hypothetical protein